ncbi:MAG: CehA/McbA family metallohydrolase [Haloarculaceae archaeon]
MLAVELHAHSAASYDGRDSVEQLLERAAEVRLDALAVTDHDEIASSRRAAELAPDYGLVGIVGLEVSSAAGHVLALDVDEAVEPGLPFGETLSRIRERGGIAVIPHPFQEMRSGVLANVSRERLQEADALEVYNSRLLTGRSNRQARRYATAHGIPMTAGSDAHVSDMVGRAVTLVDAEERTAGAICRAIREGKTTLRTRRTPWRVSFRQAVGNARRRARLFVSGLFYE